MKNQYTAAYRTFRADVNGFDSYLFPDRTAYDYAWSHVYSLFGYLIALRVGIAYLDYHNLPVKPIWREHAR